SSFPFVPGRALDAAVLELGENTNEFDIVIAYQDRPAVLYRDKKVGHYEAVPLQFSLSGPLEVGDFNQDGFLDLVSLETAGATFVENRKGLLTEPRPTGSAPKLAVFGDFQNRGRTDILAGSQLLLHQSASTYQPGKVRGSPAAWTAAVAADFTNDGL